MKKIICFAAVIAVIVAILSFTYLFNDTTYTVTVTDKERINTSEDSYYLIFCEDKDGNYYEFKNDDELLRGKVNSSSVYNRLKVGQTYRLTVIGVRIPLLSTYQNIINVEDI